MLDPLRGRCGAAVTTAAASARRLGRLGGMSAQGRSAGRPNVLGAATAWRRPLCAARWRGG